jgi:EAL domain-containing protein (putative c-di-GMP-specific phosphodiesterase class I)
MMTDEEIAEQLQGRGLEEDYVRELLASLGCELGQGHYFATSMAPELLPLWIATRPAYPFTGGTARAQLLRTVR